MPSFSLGFALCYFFYKVVIYVRFEIFKRKVIQFNLDHGDAESGCDGGIDIQRFLRDADLLFRRHMPECSHVMKTVSELDQDDPDILGHSQEHLSKISGLFFLLDLRFVFIIS